MDRHPATAVAPPQSRLSDWLNALAITLLACVLFGLGCFVALGSYLKHHDVPLFEAAVYLEIAFTGGAAVLLAVIYAWQRARGLSMADLGWGKPTTPLALGLAVVLGVLYLSWTSFAVKHSPGMQDVDVFEVNWVRLALVPLGIFLAVVEETMMRGFFMTELQRARVATWLQIVASGACSALYHCFQNPTPIGFFPSFVLFSVHAGLYVVGRRSLTPVILTHSIYHVFGEPYLIMLILAWGTIY
ncbi:MAG TPA: CPBP family intramembrane glutamic endopeptidase [Gemmataceae bacterium]|nr:CPBP family intramembrane glutamic endopeptidase [Gemmataceae bacterium]